MFSFNDKISIHQLKALLILDVFGTGMIILPRFAAEYANQDGWLVIVAATLIAAVYGFFITSVGRMFPEDNFVELASKVLSRPVGVVISLGFVFKIVVMVAMELRSFGEIVKLTMLYNTPFPVVCGAMLLIGGYAASKGYEARARIAEILIVLAFVPLIVVFFIGMWNVDFSNLKPFLVTSPKEIATGGFFAVRAFTGLEFMLLVYPFMRKPAEVRRGVVQTVFIIGLLMLFITVVTIAKFGPFDVKRQMWPVLEMMDAVDLPGAFIERQDAFIMSFWIISIFAIVNAGLFFSSLLIKDIAGRGRHSWFIGLCMVLSFGLSFVPRNFDEVYNITSFMFQTFGIAYMLVIPLVLLVTAHIRGLGRND